MRRVVLLRVLRDLDEHGSPLLGGPRRPVTEQQVKESERIKAAEQRRVEEAADRVDLTFETWWKAISYLERNGEIGLFTLTPTDKGRKALERST